MKNFNPSLWELFLVSNLQDNPHFLHTISGGILVLAICFNNPLCLTVKLIHTLRIMIIIRGSLLSPRSLKSFA